MDHKYKFFEEIEDSTPNFSGTEDTDLSSFSDEIDESLGTEGWLAPEEEDTESRNIDSVEIKAFDSEIPVTDHEYAPDVSFDQRFVEIPPENDISKISEIENVKAAEKEDGSQFVTSVENEAFWKEPETDVEVENIPESADVLPLDEQTSEPVETTEIDAVQEKIEEEVAADSCDNEPELTEPETTTESVESQASLTEEVFTEEIIEEPIKAEVHTADNDLEKVNLATAKEKNDVATGSQDDDFYRYFGDLKLSGKAVPKDDVSNTFYVNYRNEKNKNRHRCNHKKKSSKKKKKSIGKSILSWVITVVLAFVLALALNVFVIRPSEVSGDSMKPSLQNGDTVFLSRIPYLIEAPERGDIVVIDSRIPDDEDEYRTVFTLFAEAFKYNIITKLYGAGDPDYFWIKRIIGVPGDTISFKDNMVYRNGEKLREDYINESNVTTYPDGTSVEIPKGYYYVLGDNRNHSSDSRTLGLIPEANIIGKMVGQW